VSGAVFEVKADSAKYEAGGSTFYFCCGSCSSYFNKNRDAVLQKRGFKA